ATVRADAHEVRVAEITDRARTVLLSSRPKVAAGEATKHGRPPRMGSLTLQRVEDLFDGVAHATTSSRSWYVVGSETPASRKPLMRRRHESQAPQARP